MEQQSQSAASNVAPCPSCGEPAALGVDGAFVECETCGLVPITAAAAFVDPLDEGSLPEGAIRCQWCGTANPPELERCRKCNAVFPKPEMDLAMLKAAEDRLRVLEDEITLREQQRKSGLFGKLFG